MVDLSIIIISYNTAEITEKCLRNLSKSLDKSGHIKVEIIVADNGSTDDSVDMIKKIRNSKFEIRNKAIPFKIIKSKKNLGFALANNMAVQETSGKYLLFLNSDVYVKDVNFADLVYYLNKNPRVGALTVRIQLPNGRIDPASHRGIPTIWRSFTYFSRLEKFFARIPKLSKHFGGYHLSHLDLETIHEIDSPSGAFYMTRRDLFQEIGGFDNRFFMYGEDLDLSARIKKSGYKIMYYPLFRAIHLKHRSGIKRGIAKTQQKTKTQFYEAMKIFYDKHYGKEHSFFNKLVHLFIDLKHKTSR